MSFSEKDVERRTAKNTFFKQINIIINWYSIGNTINKYYSPGKNAVGQKAYDGVVLFKMLLVGIWYGLSDRDTEDMICENLSAMKFCGLQLEDNVPDHSVLSRFRTHLTKNDAFNTLLEEINNQLDAHGILLKQGCKVDATITNSPRKPRGKATYQIAEDRKEDELNAEDHKKEEEQIKAIRVSQPGVDTEGRWLKKAGKLHYGYKKHYGTEVQGLVIAVSTTAANVHDSNILGEIIVKSGLLEGASVYADKAYKSAAHDLLLKEKKLKNRIHHKAVKNKKLTGWQLKYNKLLSKRRYTVERTFGSEVKWFGAGVARYIGMAKTHTQHLLEAMCYNLKRAPRLLVERAAKLQMAH